MRDDNAFILLRNLLINHSRGNLMIICHALTGGAEVKGWPISSSLSSSLVLVQATCSGLGPLILGYGKAFDFSCVNIPGSPYETASPIMLNPDTGSSV